MFNSIMGAFFLVGKPLFSLCGKLYKGLFNGVKGLITRNMEINRARRQALAQTQNPADPYSSDNTIV